ncbi:MAG TPA: fatty acid desaturase [Terriglobia bacterium]|nr:fatty acid desaturase [Terriglobia bacterium]
MPVLGFSVLSGTLASTRPRHRTSALKILPFIGVHVACLAAFFIGFRWSYVALAVALYYARMFFVTAGYHRYFSHRSFKTSRAFQFILAFLAMTSSQKGVLWWAAHHRNHHRLSDTPEDLHSPSQQGFWWAHLGWILSNKNDETQVEMIRDYYKYPELRWLNKHFLVPPVVLAVALYLVGGWGWLVWGFFISTVMLWHGSFCVNSLAHVFGQRRYITTDTSRNSLLISLITMGEGWHNNHHHYMASVRQGFYWWELDGTYYLLKVLSWFGIVWDLRYPSQAILNAARANS